MFHQQPISQILGCRPTPCNCCNPEASMGLSMWFGKVWNPVSYTRDRSSGHLGPSGRITVGRNASRRRDTTAVSCLLVHKSGFDIPIPGLSGNRLLLASMRRIKPGTEQ
eukprot:1148991-Pelagomonas_calceolata.AAC.1